MSALGVLPRYVRILAAATAASLSSLGGCALQQFRVPVRPTGQGLVAGTRTLGATAWRDIPYAAPPVGDLRWREPAPALPWDGVLPVTDPAARDPEDCLRLSVWTEPDLAPDAARPVLVWLADLPPAEVAALDATRLCSAGLVVVVVQFRRGLLGVFSHPALERQRPGGPADFAQIDQLAALQWVHDHIADFGGDAGNVTLGGSAGGATAVLHLLGDPAARGLFHRALVQGPLAFAAPAQRADAVQAGERLLVQNGLLPATTANDLRSLSARRLLDIDTSGTALAGKVEGAHVRASPAQLFARGQQAAVPLLLGCADGAADLPVPPPHLLREWQQLVGVDDAALARIYPAILDSRRRRERAWRDFQSTASVRWLAACHCRVAPTWVYRQRFAGGSAPVGALSDLAADARLLFAPFAGPETNGAFTERWLARVACGYLSNFCRGEAPREDRAPDWPAFDLGLGAVLVLDRELAIERTSDALGPRPADQVAAPIGP